MHKDYLGRQMPSFRTSLSCFFFSQLCKLSMTPSVVGYPFCQLFQLCPLPTFCAAPALPLAGHHEELKSPWLSVNTPQWQPKHQCLINVILILHPKHSAVPATQKKNISISAKIRTIISDRNNQHHHFNMHAKIGFESWDLGSAFNSPTDFLFDLS